MMNLAIIPARQGSKRLPKKNIKLFFKKPIISYSIDVAKKTKLFDKIIVSTDSKYIKKIAENFGAEVPFIRPKKYSDDFTHFNESVTHAIKWFKEKKIVLDNVCCIYPTSPLLNYSDIIKGFKLLKKTKSFVFSACSFRSPPQRGFFFQSKKLKLLNKSNYNKRSQNLKKIFHDAGQFYWAQSNTWLKEKKIFNKNSSIVEIDYLNFMDINHIEDFDLAKKLFELKKK
jgi:pseudaminic acid cytidylyltransferase